MNLGIDGANIRSGGGVTHLVELLRAANPIAFGFDRVVVWSSQATLAQLEERPWLLKVPEPLLESHYLPCALWQSYYLSERVKNECCDLLFVPGGSFVTKFRPVVTMSQNLLPFEWPELLRFSASPTTFRLMMLRWVQLRSFKRAQGTIFLTRYARNIVLRASDGLLHGYTAIVPHGIDERFFIQPRFQKSICEYSEERPFRLLYVSIVDTYKHQWHLAEAVASLRAEGFPVVLDLIGPAYPPALRRLQQTLRRVDPKGGVIRYRGAVPYQELHNHYASVDLCVFASSCENMPNILLEGMAAGLPTACSDRGSMPEVFRNGGVYFNPENPTSIANAIRHLLESPELRAEKAQVAYELAQQYSWNRCADETFGFLRQVAVENSRT